MGDLQFLPYGDDRFDVVTGFNACPYAEDARAALAEAARDAKPGGRVLALVWGAQTELAALLDVLRPLLPPDPAGGRTGSSLSGTGVLEELFAAAVFQVTIAVETSASAAVWVLWRSSVCRRMRRSLP